jgi:hypothetical protein
VKLWTISLSVVLASALPALSAQPFDLRGVSLKFLHRHEVPCRAIATVVTALGADIATCEDGRQWALLWVEDDVAFINPQTRQLYRWESDVYRSYPQLYESVTVNSR